MNSKGKGFFIKKISISEQCQWTTGHQEIQVLLIEFFLATKGTGTGIMSNKKCSKVMMSSLQFYVFF